MNGNVERALASLALVFALAGCGDDAAPPSEDSGAAPSTDPTPGRPNRPGAPTLNIDSGTEPSARDGAVADGGTQPDVTTLDEDAGAVGSPTEPEPEPLPPPTILLTAPAGACAFESLLSSTKPTDNPACPDGVFRGDATLRVDADVAALQDCHRIAGNLTIELAEREDLRGLESLVAVEGSLRVPSAVCAAGSCAGGSPQLVSLAGLDHLRCVGGDLAILQPDDRDCAPISLGALRMLVEVGGSLDLQVCTGSDADVFESLQRVWGDLTYDARITPERLQIVYGALRALGPLGSFPSDVHVGCRGKFITCFDGVVGCAYEAENQSHVAALSMCRVALRDVNLSGTSITSLTPLSNLREVRGQLTIGVVGPVPSGADLGRLQSLAGLESLERVGWLAIGRLPFVTDLKPLESLESARSVRLDDLDGLLDLEGLEKLTRLDGTQLGDGVFWISGSSSLVALSGLKLKQLRELRLVDNAGLATLSALIPLDLTQLGVVELDKLTTLADLVGLDSLREIGELSVTRCEGLVDLTGLDELSAVERELRLEDNPQLASLEGAPKLERVGSLQLVRNPEFASFGGLPTLQSAGLRAVDLPKVANVHPLAGVAIQSLELVRLPLVTELAGLEGATGTLSTLEIIDNDRLVDLSSLDGVQTIERQLVVDANAELENLHGLEGVRVVPDVSITGNAQLEEIRALAGITQGRVVVSGNPSLPECEVRWLSERLPQAIPAATNGPPGMCPPEG